MKICVGLLSGINVRNRSKEFAVDLSGSRRVAQLVCPSWQKKELSNDKRADKKGRK